MPETTSNVTPSAPPAPPTLPTCRDCGNTFRPLSALVFNGFALRQNYCSHCVSVHAFRCDWCVTWRSNDNRSERHIACCGNCIINCDRCDTECTPSETREVEGETLCGECFCDSYASCANCDAPTSTSTRPQRNALGDEVRYCNRCSVRMQKRFQTSETFDLTLGIKRYYSIELECLASEELGRLEPSEHFSVKDDGSLNDRGVEYVLGILQGDAGIRHLETVTLDALDSGHRVDSSCGLHVHVDARDLTPPQLLNLLAVFYSWEPVIYSFLPLRRRANSYCAPPSCQLNFATVLDLLRRPVDGVRRWVSNTQRYCGLNLHALPKFGSVEFRAHSGTLDFNKVYHWLLLCLALVELATDAGRMHALNPDANWSGFSMRLPTPDNVTAFCAMLKLPKESLTYFTQRYRRFNHAPAVTQPLL